MIASRWTGIWLLVALAAAGTGCGDDESGGQTAASSTSGTTTSSTSNSSTSGAGGAGTGGAGGAGGSGSSSVSSTGTTMGTPCAGNTCDITFIGTGFTPHEGQDISAGAVRQGNMGFDWEATTVVQNGSFTLEGTGVLQKGQPYNLNYYADVNGNGGCDITPTDHVWRLDLGVVQENLTITVGHNTNFSNIGCGGFP